VNGADVVRTASHLLGQDSRDRAGAESVAERLTGPEVRGERHRRQELGQTERARQRSGVRAHHGRNANRVQRRIQPGAEKLRAHTTLRPVLYRNASRMPFIREGRVVRSRPPLARIWLVDG
jgi:hypothetical protein